MKTKMFFPILFLIVTMSASAQVEAVKEFHYKALNWRIMIPSGTSVVSEQEWNRMEQKGAEAIEKTFGEKVENTAQTLFVVKFDEMNYFEANQQPYDSITDPDYPAYFRAVNEILYETFKEQIPNGTIDTASSEELIAGLLFQKFRISIGLPNNMVIRLFMYSRPFADKELTVNIMYVDEEKGIRMMSAWKKSTFGK